MDWLDAGLNEPLIVVRAIHFAATAVTTGALIFRAVVLEPALRSDEGLCAGQKGDKLRKQSLSLAWIGLGLTLASGAIWLLIEAASMSERPLAEAMSSSLLLTVLQQTQFGQVCEIRLLLSAVLAACLAYHRFGLVDRLALGAGLGLAAAIAWTGHAGSTPGELGNLHLTADALHLLAASAWIGGLVPLVLLLAAAGGDRAFAWPSLTRNATKRFSTLGVVGVATLAATGIINAWILVGSFHALLSTGYGRLLTLKLGLVGIMLVFAASNRFWLTPRLTRSSGNELPAEVLHQLTRNSVIEIALGFGIFAIVGMLGMMHPAIHLL
ncbi:MAG TPA: copper homeostasis membrane protein CopD [Bradyrhizobium sp.]|jgi:putative copper resistance protein D|uniref:copper homeostasis membrane protein CopD n=1 Tax=Bradyrhizobium sp. TaxID=376 RepID=UPI002B47CADC|nr:copper homeostasis membrane protein CopD [Bradyrhizobium sp.]HKO70011.1 copper homeostasis membrane protein CopD [Bradyrhizobium sp.]